MFKKFWNKLTGNDNSTGKNARKSTHKQQYQDGRIILPNGTEVSTPGGYEVVGDFDPTSGNMILKSIETGEELQVNLITSEVTKLSNTQDLDSVDTDTKNTTNAVSSDNDDATRDSEVSEDNFAAVDAFLASFNTPNPLERVKNPTSLDGSARGRSSYLEQRDDMTFRCELCGSETTLEDETKFDAKRIENGVHEYGVIGGCLHCEQHRVIEHATEYWNEWWEETDPTVEKIVFLNENSILDWTTAVAYNSNYGNSEQHAAIQFIQRYAQSSRAE